MGPLINQHDLRVLPRLRLGPSHQLMVFENAYCRAHSQWLLIGLSRRLFRGGGRQSPRDVILFGIGLCSTDGDSVHSKRRRQ